MAMYRNIVSYITCMVYVLCKIIIIININKFVYFSYIDVIISVYGIVCVNNNIINHIVIRRLLFLRFGALLMLWLLTTPVVYWFICLDMLFVLWNVLSSDLLYKIIPT